MKKLKRSLFYFIASLLAVISLCSCAGEETEHVDLKIIRECPELETARFCLRKIIVYDGTRTIVRVWNSKWDAPSRILVLPIDITVIGKIDFSNVGLSNIIDGDSSVVFVLPDPTLTVMSTIDNEMREKASRETKVPLLGKLQGFSDDEVKQIALQAYDSIMVERCLSMMLERTRENAANIMIPLVAEVKGISEEHVKVQFRSDLTPADAAMIDEGKTKKIVFRRKE
jgi:hypothetical protein